MKFSNKLIQATIQKRYKRFLADVTISDSGEQLTAHVPNTGAMTNCWAPDWPALLSKSDNPKRKLPYTLEMTHNGKSFIGVNTSLTNKIAKEAIETGIITELNDYGEIKAEQKYGDSRLDFKLSGHKKFADTFVEVKNVTLNDNSTAIFPDAVTTRGQKHLQELIKIKNEGYRAVMLYIIAREDINKFSPARNIDPEYSRLLQKAFKNGVEILAYQCKLNQNEIKVYKRIEICL